MWCLFLFSQKVAFHPIELVVWRLLWLLSSLFRFVHVSMEMLSPRTGSQNNFGTRCSSSSTYNKILSTCLKWSLHLLNICSSPATSSSSNPSSPVISPGGWHSQWWWWFQTGRCIGAVLPDAARPVATSTLDCV